MTKVEISGSATVKGLTLTELTRCKVIAYMKNRVSFPLINSHGGAVQLSAMYAVDFCCTVLSSLTSTRSRD
jgi:hypothetical protein